MVGYIQVKPFPKRQILDSSKMKKIADGNFKFDENGRELSKRIENTVAKGEIARYEQFLIFPVFSKNLNCISKDLYCRHVTVKTRACLGKGYFNSSGHITAVGDAHVFPGFLTPVQTQISFQSHRLFFSHASAQVRGENMPERNFASTGSRTHNHQVTSPTRLPLSHPVGFL